MILPFQLLKNIQMIRRFMERLSNLIQITLCPHLDETTLEMRHFHKAAQILSSEDSFLSLKQETLQTNIRNAGRTAKEVYECSKKFIESCDLVSIIFCRMLDFNNVTNNNAVDVIIFQLTVTMFGSGVADSKTDNLPFPQRTSNKEFTGTCSLNYVLLNTVEL